MIPFDLETWKANPDCEVYYVHDNHLIEELTYFQNARLNQFCGVVSETHSLELYSGDELMLKLPETETPSEDITVLHFNNPNQEPPIVFEPDGSVVYRGRKIESDEEFRNTIKEFVSFMKGQTIKSPRSNADVIRAYADGLDVYFRDAGEFFKYAEFDVEYPPLGDEDYEWHIGKPDEDR